MGFGASIAAWVLGIPLEPVTSVGGGAEHIKGYISNSRLLLLGSPVVPFYPFSFWVPLLKPNSRNKGTLIIKGLLGNLVWVSAQGMAFGCSAFWILGFGSLKPTGLRLSIRV